MLYFIIILLLINLYIVYISFGKNFISPSFIFTFGLIFCCFIALLVQNSWDFCISLETVFIIYLSEIIFLGGELAVFFLVKSKKKKYISSKIKIINNNKIGFGVCLLAYILAFIYIRGLLNAAREAGWSGRTLGLLYYIRQATQYNEDITLSRLSSWSFNILDALAYYAGFSLIFFVSSRKTKFFSLMILFSYIIAIVFSAGRFPLIVFFIYLLSLYMIRKYQQNKWNSEINKKLVRIVTLPILFFAIVFLLLGFARRNRENDQNAGRKIIDTVAIYAGSGVIAFDQYIVKERISSSYPGQTTLNGFFSFLNKFGFNYPTQKNPLAFITLAHNLKTNIYSAFGRLVPDYGIFGCFSIIFLMSLFYSFFFYMVKNNQGYFMLIYGAMIYPIFLIGIEEEFLVRFLSTDFFVKIVFCFFVFWGLKISIPKRYLRVNG